jgi:hypothetical protein
MSAQTLPTNANELPALTIHGIPVLPAYRKRGQWWTWREPEQRWHFHGLNDTTGPVHLSEHCIDEQSPYRPRGYYLVLVGIYEDLPDDLRRKRKRLDRKSRRAHQR